jgi:hypothetical protein
MASIGWHTRSAHKPASNPARKSLIRRTSNWRLDLPTNNCFWALKKLYAAEHLKIPRFGVRR